MSHKVKSLNNQQGEDRNSPLRASASMAILPSPSMAGEVMKYVSSLDSSTTRWMNKRRPKSSAALPRHIMPAIAVQLKQLFDNFDMDHSGEIDLIELKRAVKFVADACPEAGGKRYSAKDAQAITNFFTSMDANNNGVVDFVEFLAAITTAHSENGAEEMTNATRRLQAAFIEFATLLRRKRLTNNVFSEHRSSLEKVESLKELYSINYFVDAGLDEEPDPIKVNKQWDAFNGGVMQNRRKKEMERARTAMALIKSKRSLPPPVLSDDTSTKSSASFPLIVVHKRDVVPSIYARPSLPKIVTVHRY
eukprot:gene4899-5372_t